MTSAQVNAVVEAVTKIEDVEFTEYKGGWQNEIGTALLDAVFSIRAKYNAADPAKGVSGRVRRFRELYPEARNDLASLASLGEETIRDVMGNTVTGSRPKAVCVVEAAQAMINLDPPVITAEDALALDGDVLRKVYTSVKGLGPVTAEYFQMHLGIPGVKADRMIIRFINRALRARGLEPTSHWSEARDLVIQAFEMDARGAESLNAFEHGIWRVESAGTLTEGDDE